MECPFVRGAKWIGGGKLLAWDRILSGKENLSLSWRQQWSMVIKYFHPALLHPRLRVFGATKRACFLCFYFFFFFSRLREYHSQEFCFIDFVYTISFCFLSFETKRRIGRRFVSIRLGGGSLSLVKDALSQSGDESRWSNGQEFQPRRNDRRTPFPCFLFPVKGFQWNPTGSLSEALDLFSLIETFRSAEDRWKSVEIISFQALNNEPMLLVPSTTLLNNNISFRSIFNAL